MTTASPTPSPARPRPRDVFVAQLRFLGLALRRHFAIGAAVLLALLVLPLFEPPVNYGREIGAWFALLGFLLPFAVWKALRGDGHLWTLPVEHRRHAIVGVAAGWCWLMVAGAVALLWIVAVVVLNDGRLRVEEARMVLDTERPAGAPYGPGDVTTIVWRTPAWLWLVPFTAATAFYLLGSALVLATRHAWRWLAGVALALALVLGLRVEGRRPLLDRLGAVVDAPYGLETAVAGSPLGDGRDEVVLTTGARTRVWRRLPAFGPWLGATALWGGAGLALLWLATLRLRERERGDDPLDATT